jgi:hypothetical protein
MNTIIEYHARYSDGYAYKVVYDPAERKTYLATEDGGRMDVPYYINGAEFVEFYFTGRSSGMSVQYAWKIRAQMDQLLSIPVKPAEPPAPKVEDSRLHVEPRQPGQSSFRQLQEANLARVNAERKQREQARAEVQRVAADPNKISSARDLNNQLAQAKRPRGKGQYLINE